MPMNADGLWESDEIDDRPRDERETGWVTLGATSGGYRWWPDSETERAELRRPIEPSWIRSEERSEREPETAWAKSQFL